MKNDIYFLFIFLRNLKRFLQHINKYIKTLGTVRNAYFIYPQKSESSSGPTYIEISENKTNSTPPDPDDIILQTDISHWLLLKASSKDVPEVRGGNPDALIVLATKATKGNLTYIYLYFKMGIWF